MRLFKKRHKNKVYFIVSDIHSCFGALRLALSDAGFNKHNRSHILVVNGDILDHGNDTLAVYDYLKSLSKKRLILIKGNHEYLYQKLLTKDFPAKFDFTNGTVKTFCDIAGYSETAVFVGDVWKLIRDKVKASKVTKFINTRFVDYFEIGNYLITHSFIPVKIKDDIAVDFSKYRSISQVPSEYLEPVSSWREAATNDQFENATWQNPYQRYKDGLFDTEIAAGKTLICGHHPTYLLYEDTPANFNIYEDNNFIDIDACASFSNKINVLKIYQKGTEFITKDCTK